MHINSKSSAPVPASGLPLLRGLKVLAASCLLLPALVLAQEDAFGLHEKNIERVENAQKIGMLSADVFGDRISHFSGGLSFNNVDVSLPGNSGLPVELRRSFSVQDRREFTAVWERPGLR